MSNRLASVGGTLTGGIQDVAALLPLIGTEQCEKHVGSALAGGYLYAAATSLSIFGSLGIVKGGITTLISSISILFPYISISFSNYKLSIKFSSRRKWLGGRVLKDAGFEPIGSVAPLIGIEGNRFRAETRLIEMLEEKHIDDPDKVFVDWKSRQWNIMLVLSTILGAFLSMTPYIALLLGPASWRPKSVHLPWLFPALRIVGSCTSIIACQFIIQRRVISLMKNRILFMTIQQRLKDIYKDKLDGLLKDSKVQWDESLPAEQCIWNLERHISSIGPMLPPVEPLDHSHHSAEGEDTGRHSSRDTATVGSEEDAYGDSSSAHSFTTSESLPEGDLANTSHVAIPMNTLQNNTIPQPHVSSEAQLAPSPQIPTFKIDDLHALQHQHFPTPLHDTVFISLSWFFLFVSLPATVAGYIGCFTLVSAAPSLGNGPLIWVGLEAALSILRILIWASNPAFDEETEIMVGIKLSEHQPMVTTIEHNRFITDFRNKKRKPFTLIPEREFLEHITPYTGPVDQFQKPENITLYFTMTTRDDDGANADANAVSERDMWLIMTVLVSDTQIGVSMMFSEKSFHYVDVTVRYHTVTRQLEGHIQSGSAETRPWRQEDDSLFDGLEAFYHYIVGVLTQRDIESVTATLVQKWDLSRNSQPNNKAHHPPLTPTPQFKLTEQNVLYINRGYEHHLKYELIATLGGWISTDMESHREQGNLGCWEGMRGATSENGIWEYTELDCQLVWGWTRRELALLELSMDLEHILQTRMSRCISHLVDVRKDERLTEKMRSEFEGSRWKRLQQEREAARERMEGAMKNASEKAEKQGRTWQGDRYFLPPWTMFIKFIDKQWSLVITDDMDALKGAEQALRKRWEVFQEWRQGVYGDKYRHAALKHLRQQVSHEHWHDHKEQFERQILDTTFEAIRKLPSNSTREQLAGAYKFPEPDKYATAKFVLLRLSSSQGKACSAMVYDAELCGKKIVCDVIAKRTTRSVVNVHPDVVASIPPNDHLLFLSCKDGRGEEPAFVRQNRDRWPGQQTKNSAVHYYTPNCVKEQLCWVYSGETIANILVFLTSSCNLHVSLIHCSEMNKASTVSLQKNDLELATLSDISDGFWQLHDFPPFVLPEGRHELKLVFQCESEEGIRKGVRYFLNNIIIKSSPIMPTIESSLVQGPGPGIMSNLDNETPKLWTITRPTESDKFRAALGLPVRPDSQ